MSNILVVGGAGYVGSALVPALLDKHNVTVMDTFWFGDHLPKHANLVRIAKDARDITRNDLVGIDIVIYLAGLSNDPMSEMLPEKCFIYNTAMPLHCAMTAKSTGVKKFIFASSCSVYGYSPEREMEVTAPIHCNYPYGVSKYAAEQGLLALNDDYFTVIALRKGTISGYSPRMRFDLLINTMYKNVMKEGVIRINNPELRRPILYIQDAVSVYCRCVNEPIHGGVYNVISYNTTLGCIARDVKEWCKKPVDMKVSFVGDMRSYNAHGDLYSAQYKMNIFPYVTTEMILKNIDEHKNEYEDLNSVEYSNNETCKKLIGLTLL